MKRRDFLAAGGLFGCTAPIAANARAANRNVAGDSHIIDAHCHAGRGMNYGSDDPTCAPWTTYNDPRWTLDQMAECGISQSIVFPISNTTYEQANQEIASYIRRWPEKLIGFAKHDAKTEGGRIRDMLRHEVRELGLKGLKLHGVPTKEMVETAAMLEIPILFHPPNVNDSLDIIKSYPQVSFILAHLGSFASRNWMEHVRAIDAAKQLSNLHLDTSSVVFFQYLAQAARELPPEKLIFGSDGPLVDSRVELHKIRLLRLPPDKEAMVLGKNIRRLLGES